MKVTAKSSSLSVKGWFLEGEVLSVLSVSAAPLEGVKFLIWSSLQEAAVLFSGAEFEVVDKSLSQRWVFSIDSHGFLDLAPEAWQDDGFWERYHDEESIAEQTFMREMALIIGE